MYQIITNRKLFKLYKYLKSVITRYFNAKTFCLPLTLHRSTMTCIPFSLRPSHDTFQQFKHWNHEKRTLPLNNRKENFCKLAKKVLEGIYFLKIFQRDSLSNLLFIPSLVVFIKNQTRMLLNENPRVDTHSISNEIFLLPSHSIVLSYDIFCWKVNDMIIRHQEHNESRM